MVFVDLDPDTYSKLEYLSFRYCCSNEELLEDLVAGEYVKIKPVIKYNNTI